MKDKLQKICMCECHNVGSTVMHYIPCCDLCYKRYIVDGEVDNKMLSELYKKPKKRKKRG